MGPGGIRMTCGAGMIALALGALDGCGSPSICRWGAYEPSIHALYQNADDERLREQIEVLAKDVEHIRRSGRKVPPGMLGHLGYLCYLSGDPAAAAEYLEAEGEAFPESARFVETMERQIQ